MLHSRQKYDPYLETTRNSSYFLINLTKFFKLIERTSNNVDGAVTQKLLSLYYCLWFASKQSV